MNKQTIDTLLLTAGSKCPHPAHMRDLDIAVKYLDAEQVFGVKNTERESYRCDSHLDADGNVVGILLELTTVDYYGDEEVTSTTFDNELPLTPEEVALFTEECRRLF